MQKTAELHTHKKTPTAIFTYRNAADAIFPVPKKNSCELVWEQPRMSERKQRSRTQALQAPQANDSCSHPKGTVPVSQAPSTGSGPAVHNTLSSDTILFWIPDGKFQNQKAPATAAGGPATLLLPGRGTQLLPANQGFSAPSRAARSVLSCDYHALLP